MPSHFIDVAIPGPFPNTFTYEVDEALPAIGARVKVPLGNRNVIGFTSAVNTQSQLSKDKIRKVQEVLDETSLFSQDMWNLCTWAANYYHHPMGEVLSAALPKLLRDGLEAQAKYEKSWQLTDLGKGLSEKSLKRAPKQRECISLLAQQGALSSKTLSQHGINRSILTALNDKQLIEAVETTSNTVISTKQSVQLNEEQAIAAKAIQDNQGTHLLYGVTGSGKTEVYLQEIQHMLNHGQQVLVILPEINLTPQFVARFESRLGIPVEALHSGLTDRQRLNIWCKAKDGSLAVVIGTRSAIFTPFKSLGLIIVDEEHSQSLKQQEGFRYSARDLAVYRTNTLQVRCVLGSATPALESYENAITGRYSLIRLTNRALTAQPPSWKIVDLRQETLHAGVSETALNEASKTLNRGEHVLFFINRLGYAPNIQCHQCGWHAQCHQCDSNLRVFLHKRELRCGHCDSWQPLPNACPSCGNPHLQTTGQGTEQIEHYLQQYFDHPIVRIDSESTQRKGALQERLARLKQASACVIVGTQMMAKGHDFSRLSLVVVLNADDGFVSSDCRANEKMAQLLTQVAGRAGRGDIAGNVIVQTYQPSHPLLTLLAANDYQPFLEQERNLRKQRDLPPNSYDAHILVTSKQPTLCLETLTNLSQRYQWPCTLIGPQPATLARKAGWFRSVLTLRATQRKQLHESLTAATQWLYQQQSHQLRWSVDIDPIDTP